MEITSISILVWAHSAVKMAKCFSLYKKNPHLLGIKLYFLVLISFTAASDMEFSVSVLKRKFLEKLFGNVMK